MSAIRKFVDAQQWLDTLADPMQQWITSLFAGGGDKGKQIKNALNGVWLGHPLHPVLTDVPVGAWTCTFVLDTLASVRDDDALASAADITLATGLAGAAGSAISGWTDWSDTYGPERKMGLLHGLLMGGATVTYAMALAARLTGNRRAGVVLANTGYAMMSAGAYLGGDIVYDIGYGVNHTAFQHGPTSFVPVLPEADLQEGKPTKGNAGGVDVVLVKQGGQIYALDDTCVHAGCSLAGGSLQGRSIICPCHGSQFDLQNGAVMNGPATVPEPHYKVRVTDGTIEVMQEA